jgi:hypothetical protein
MWVLIIAGPLVERMVGNFGFLVLYLTAGLCGSLLSLLWHPLVISAGASGAVFGIYGALLGLLVRSGGSLPAKVLEALRDSGLAFVGYNLIFGFILSDTIDNAAHIGGLIGGFLCGVVLSQPFTIEARTRRPVRNILLIVSGIALVAGGLVGVMHKHPDVANMGPHPDRMVEHGSIEVYYTSNVTKAEADRLGEYVAKARGRNTDSKASLQLRKTPAGYQFGVVIKKEFQNDPDTLRLYEIIGARISRDVFDGAAVETHICDSSLQTVHVVPPRDDIRHSIVEGNVELFFATDVNKTDAERLVRYLAKLANGSGTSSYKLAKRGSIMEVYGVCDKGSLKNAEVLQGLREVRNDIATNVFPGATVELHLCDDLFTDIQVLKP